MRSVCLVRFTCYAFTFVLGVSGCGVLHLNSSTNSEYDDAHDQAPVDTIASAFVEPGHRGRDDTLVILSFSGGGSRAAYMAAKVMFELEKWFVDDEHLLAEVDAISSVSGGSLAAAYYAITREPGPESEAKGPVRYRLWNERKVLREMKKNYILKWFGNWFWPHNVVRYWLTDFDRTDIMAKTFADNMFDRPGLKQRDYTIGQLNPERPHLVLNATNATAGKVSPAHHEARTYTKQSNADVSHDELEAAAGQAQFGSPFRFTQEQFKEIHSDIRDYSLARAVMATASFPAVFNYMTLRDYSSSDGRYVHLFDGGTSDNQGLSGVLEILERSACHKPGADPGSDDCKWTYEKVVVIFVDAYTGTGGVSAGSSDGRSFTDFVVDLNFIDATESLLFANRDQRTNAFYDAFKKYFPASNKGIYYHITLDDIENEKLKTQAQQVGTSFNLTDDNADILNKAVVELMKPTNVCLLAIVDLLHKGSHKAESNCKNPLRP